MQVAWLQHCGVDVENRILEVQTTTDEKVAGRLHCFMELGSVSATQVLMVKRAS